MWYMAVEKLCYYHLTEWSFRFVTIFPDSTLNVKVNNWGVELSDYNVKIEFIKRV